MLPVIIDFHTHVFSPDIIKNRQEYCQRDPNFASIYMDPKAKMADTEDLLIDMNQNRVTRSVILNFSWTDSELCNENNEYIMKSIRQHPDRLIGFCNVCLSAGRTAIKELQRCINGGVKGIGEIRLDAAWIDVKRESLIRSIVDIIIERNLIFLVHASEPVGHEYPGKWGGSLDILYKFITRYPDLKIVCAHLGGGLPFYALMPEVKTALKNVYFDTAASPFLYTPQIFHHFIILLGSQKLLFGSDYPLMTTKKTQNYMDSARINKANKYNILAKNANEILGLV